MVAIGSPALQRPGHSGESDRDASRGLRFAPRRTTAFSIVYRATMFAIGLAWSGMAAAEDRPPNLVFFLTDDQTQTAVGCYGNPIIQTPNIDRLAARGVRFDNATVSHSICWVSRTTLLTGLTGRTYGTPGNRELARPEAVETLVSDRLRTAGYRTGFFGKWHAKMPKGYEPKDHFDEFEAIGRNPFFKKQPDGSLRHETDLIVDRGIEFLRSQAKDRPFALNMWFNACHAEDSDRRPGIGHFTWPQSADGLYADVTFPPPKLNSPQDFDVLPEFIRTDINRQRYFWRWNTPEKYQTNMQAYARMTTGIDSAIGRFLEALDEAGMADNTIVVYSADNGYHMANRGLAGKWTHFEESLRVPMIIADLRASSSPITPVHQPVLNLDLPATFLDAAGIEVPESYQGESLMRFVRGQTPDQWRRDAFHEHFAVRNRIAAWEGVRNERFKYARYVDHDDYEFLFDLTADPLEQNNLADAPESEPTLIAMRAATDRYLDQYGGKLHPLDQPFKKSVDPNPVSSAAATIGEAADQFQSLFNGNNLKEWSGDDRHWSVRDGCITGVTDGTLKMNRFLTWKSATVRNFDLEMEVKVSPGGNSGIQYRSVMRPDLGLDIAAGYQCDVVADRPDYNGMLYEEKQRRILARSFDRVVIDADGQPWIVERMDSQSFEPDQWHRYRVLAAGNHLRHWIDDVPTVDVIDLDAEGRSLDGVLGMQVHVGPAMTIQFRNLRIKHLPDDLPLRTPEDTPIPPGSRGVKPQGRLPANWQPPIYGAATTTP